MIKVVILGGGPAGCASAYYLRQKGIEDITIIEKESIGGCSRTSFYESIPFEFGPQILYTEEADIRHVFEKFVTLYYPPNPEKKYRPMVSIDGTLDTNSLHDFPVTFNNILKHSDAVKIVEEIYRLNLEKPDFTNFEQYVISRMGETLYETYVKNYNIKQWGIHPKDMDVEWAKFRPLSISPNGKGMFKSDWQGHPGDYTPLWAGLTKDVNIIKGTAKVSEDFKSVFVNGETIDADLYVSTLPLSGDLKFIDACLIYVSIKSENTIMPSYATSFPNNYDFVRIMEYRQQFSVESSFTLLDFQFPVHGPFSDKKFIEQVNHFVKNILKKEIFDLWVEYKPNIYPVSTRETLLQVEEKIELASLSKVIPIGRAGVHAYISKDTCLRMARIMTDDIQDVCSGDPFKKKKVLKEMRAKLS